MVSHNNDRPSAYIRFRQINFVQVNLGMLAPLAYQNYLIHGPGLVLVDESCFINEPSGVLVKIPWRYITENSPDYKVVLGPKEKSWLKSYNAALELLIGFARAGGKYSCYRLGAASPDKTPEALFKKGGRGDDSNISGQS